MIRLGGHGWLLSVYHIYTVYKISCVFSLLFTEKLKSMI